MGLNRYRDDGSPVPFSFCYTKRLPKEATRCPIYQGHASSMPSRPGRLAGTILASKTWHDSCTRPKVTRTGILVTIVRYTMQTLGQRAQVLGISCR